MFLQTLIQQGIRGELKEIAPEETARARQAEEAALRRLAEWGITVTEA